MLKNNRSSSVDTYLLFLAINTYNDSTTEDGASTNHMKLIEKPYGITTGITNLRKALGFV